MRHPDHLSGKCARAFALYAGTTILLFQQICLAEPVFTPGLLKMEIYDLSDRYIKDLSVPVLTTHPSFPNSPTQVLYVHSFDSTYGFPDRLHDQYGSRISGVFVPSETGRYIFYLRSDDASELWFNPAGTDPAGKIRIIEQIGCCNLFGEKPSAPYTLTAGHHYYIESLHREGPEFDYVQVAAKLESDPHDPDFLLPISYQNIGLYAEPGATITSLPAHNAIAVLPESGSDPILLAEEFDSGGGGFTVTSTNAKGPWTYSSDRTGAWIATGHQLCAGIESTTLTSPTVQVEHAGEVFLLFRHRYSFEFDGLNHDGGQLRLRVNGAPYAPVSASRFKANGYTGVVQGNNALIGQQAFVSTQRGHQSGYHVTSVASLGSFNPGDTLSVQFVAAWDECHEGNYPDWEIDSVYITHTVTRVDVGAVGSTPAIPVAYSWQVDTGSGYVELGSVEPALWLAPTSADNGTRYRALLALPGISVFSEPVTVRVTREPVCRIGGPYVATCATSQAGLAVQLDASASTDPENEGLSFAWDASCGGATFDDPTSATPTLFLGAGMNARSSCTVSVTVTDGAGASVTCSTPVDTSQSLVPPVLEINGGDQSFTCDAGQANQYVELGATAIDGCGRPIDVIYGPPADTRKKGTQVVTYNAVDVFGNEAAQLTRTVVVNEPPVQLLNIPANFVAECSTVGGASKDDSAVAAYLSTPVAFDGCDSDETVNNDAPAILPLGTTRVTWTVWDGGPTNLTGSANITVQDTAEPTINCAPIRIAADQNGNTVVPEFRTALSVSDACTPSNDLIIVQDPPAGTPLEVGTYGITLTVTDAAATPHTATCSTTLEVTAFQNENNTTEGCGAPACGGNALMSLSATVAGLTGMKRAFNRRRKK